MRLMRMGGGGSVRDVEARARERVEIYASHAASCGLVVSYNETSHG